MVKRGLTATTAEVVQKSDYYAFGKRHANFSYDYNENGYLYNDKELQDEIRGGTHAFGSDYVQEGQYDYGARFYDAEIVRFKVIDMFAEKYYSMTPYQYGGLDPIKHTGVNGDSIWVTINTTLIDANGQTQTVTNRYYYGAD